VCRNERREQTMRRKTRALSVLAAGVMVIVVTLGLAGPANAGTGIVDFHDTPYARVTAWGQVWVVNDETEWDLHFRLGVNPNQQCVFVRVQIDRTLGSDPVEDSASLCPGDNGVINFGSGVARKHSRTRGARVEAHWVNSGSREIIYVRE
jgi:hypothetical protein